MCLIVRVHSVFCAVSSRLLKFGSPFSFVLLFLSIAISLFDSYCFVYVNCNTCCFSVLFFYFWFFYFLFVVLWLLNLVRFTCLNRFGFEPFLFSFWSTLILYILLLTDQMIWFDLNVHLILITLILIRRQSFSFCIFTHFYLVAACWLCISKPISISIKRYCFFLENGKRESKLAILFLKKKNTNHEKWSKWN